MPRKSQGRSRWILIVLMVLVAASALTFTALTRAKVLIDKSKLSTVTRGDLAKSVPNQVATYVFTNVDMFADAKRLKKVLKL